MIKPHHPQTRYERIKLRAQKEQKKYERDSEGHVRKRVAVEAIKQREAAHELQEQFNKAEEAQHEVEQFTYRSAPDGI